jgi:hypothetical protein
MRIAAALALAALGSCASEPPARIESRVHLGKPNTWFLEAVEPKVEAAVMTEVGARIVRYALAGENILWENEDAAGNPRAGGGFQLDIGPEMRQIPRHDAIWSGRYEGAPVGVAGLRVSSAADPGLGLQVIKEIGIDSRNGALEIVGRMRNVTKGEVSYCFWDRTLCKPGGWTLVKLNPKSRFKAGWVLGKRVPGKASMWSYDGDAPAHPSMKVLDGVLVVKTGGPEQKCGADTMAGWIAYARGKLLFVKHFPCYPEGNYSDGGMSVAHYYRETMSELEPISPEVTVKPGQDYVFPQMWSLIRLEKEIESFEEARKLVDRIPSSPFAR